MRIVPVLGLLLAVAGQAWAQTNWPHAQDIPKPAPSAVGLAGSAEPDLVRYVTARGPLGDAEISPDGETVAYRHEVTGQAQVWALDLAGGQPRQLTFGGRVSGFSWSPQGELLIAADRDGDEREGYTILSRDGLKERLARERSQAFVSFGDWSPDGARMVYSSTERNGDDFDIFLGSADGGAPREVFRGRFGNFVEAWRPASEQVLVSETRGEDANDVYVLDLASGKRQVLFKPKVASSYVGFQFTPAGDGFYFATNQDREFAALAFYDMVKGKLQLIDAPEADVEEPTLFGNGRYLAWTVNDGGYSRLKLRDLQTGRDLPAPELPLGVYALSGAAEAPILLAHVNGPRTPGELWVLDARSGAARRIVAGESAGLDLSTFVVPESLRFAARDGVQLQGLLYVPQSASPPPVVISVHGGPTGQARPGFRARTQYLLANGIAVFDLNFRGSTGFGKTFARLDNQELRLNAVRDVADAVAFLKSTGRVDVSRAAVMGGSYGGYLTNAAVGEFPDLFKAGVSYVGVSDWVHALENASPALKASDQIEYGDITNPKWRTFYAELSPIRKADAIQAAMLVVHGANDPRDPVAESDRLVERLRANGREVVYLRFPDEGHGIGKLENRLHEGKMTAAFLKAQLQAQ